MRAGAIANQAVRASRSRWRTRLEAAAASLRLARRHAERTRDRPAQHAAALGVLAVREARYRQLQGEVDAAVATTFRPSLRILQRATAPTSAQFPSPDETPILGALLGLLAGSAAAVQRGHAGRKVRAAQDLDARDKPVLGVIPRVRGLLASRRSEAVRATSRSAA